MHVALMYVSSYLTNTCLDYIKFDFLVIGHCFILAAFLKIKIPLVYSRTREEKSKPNLEYIIKMTYVNDPCSFDLSVKFNMCTFYKWMADCKAPKESI